jgi:hypothetical protein
MRKFSVLNFIEDVPSLADGVHYGKDMAARKVGFGAQLLILFLVVLCMVSPTHTWRKD